MSHTLRHAQCGGSNVAFALLAILVTLLFTTQHAAATTLDPNKKHLADYVFVYRAWIVFAVVLPVVCLLATQIPYIRDKTAIGRIVNYKYVTTKLSRTTWLDTFTLNARQTLQDLKVGEALVVATAIALFGVFALYMYNELFAHHYGKAAWIYGSGHLIVIALALTLIPINRISILQLLCGTSFERFIKYHRWCGRVALLFSYVHCMGFVFIQYAGQFDKRILHNDKPFRYGGSVLHGFISFITMNITVFAGLEVFRRCCYENFWVLHAVAGLVTVGFGMSHSIHFRYAAIVPLTLYGIDKAYQFYCLNVRKVNIVGMRQIIHHSASTPYKVTQLQLQINNFKYHAGSFIFLNIPRLALLEHHPFSISSAPTDNADDPFTVTIVERNTHALLGKSFTKRLYDMLEQRADDGKAGAAIGSHAFKALKQSLWCRVEGPVGSFSIYPQNYPLITIVAGGSGVAPMISLVKWLIQQKQLGALHCIACHFVWVSQFAESFTTWFPTEMQTLLANNSWIKLHLYYTKVAATLGEPIDTTEGSATGGSGSQLAASSASISTDDQGIELTVASQVQEQQLQKDDKTALPAWDKPRDESFRSTGSEQQTAKLYDETEKAWDEVREVTAAGASMQKHVEIDSSMLQRLNIVRGRPDFRSLFERISVQHSDIVLDDRYLAIGSSAMGVFVCGPENMVAEVHTVANTRGYHLHKERYTF